MLSVSFFYDAIIFGFLLVDGLLIVLLVASKLTRQRKYIFVALAALAWLTIFYGSFIEPEIIVVTRQNIKWYRDWLGEKPSGDVLRVALVSDFHVGPYKKDDFVKKAVDKINALKPDLVLIIGDFVFDDKNQVQFLTPLKTLSSSLGIFAILGNHDYGLRSTGVFGTVKTQEESNQRKEIIKRTLEKLGVKVLINEVKKIKKGDKEFLLIGMDELWTGRADVKKVLKTLEKTDADYMPGGPLGTRFHVKKLSILLSHNPDIVNTDNLGSGGNGLGIDLVLTGHTHGGQIRLPFIGSVTSIPTETNFDKGYFELIKGPGLFVTSGIGEWGPRARLFNPPEIALLEILQ